MPRTVYSEQEKWALSRSFAFLKASKRMTYDGFRIIKNPLDLWVFRQIMAEQRPELIVEFGTFHGGSALWFAHQMDSLGLLGKVLTFDIKPPPALLTHPRIEFVCESAISPAAVEKVTEEVYAARGKVLFIEDSRHTFVHVYNVLKLYCNLVPPRGYFIVEDGKTHGVFRALERFLSKHPEFFSDKERESFGITACFNGFLCRKS